MTVHSSTSRKAAVRVAGLKTDASVSVVVSNKRERILDAAEVIFAAHGFFAARVSQIAEQAGVADGTIYLYFKSKDDLLISLFESRMERLIAMLSKAIDGLPPAAQLRAFVTQYLTSVHDEPAAAEVMTVELRQSSKFMHDYENPRFVDFFRLLVGIISAGQASGDFARAIPAPMVGRMIFGMLDELSTSWVLANDRPVVVSKRDKSPQGERTAPVNKGVRAGSHRPKKFDIVQAAKWVNTLVANGLSTV
jgi:TetR/AcrR family transcriptional regulator, fatty acid metabolism regulator protein